MSVVKVICKILYALNPKFGLKKKQKTTTAMVMNNTHDSTNSTKKFS